MDPIHFEDAAAFDTWLAANHAASDGVWMKIAKKGSGIPSITEDETVDVGLCWGWISGQRKALDDKYYLQKYVPRRPRGHWSRVNVDKVAKLLAAGRMRPPGLAEVEAAKADGRWSAAYPSQRDFTTPLDLDAALTENPRAAAAYAALDRTRQYALVLDLLRARTPGTRANRLARTLAMLSADN
ncbi:YdeI/OmpD-associated family protein [Nocardia sp. IFM 10818]